MTARAGRGGAGGMAGAFERLDALYRRWPAPLRAAIPPTIEHRLRAWAASLRAARAGSAAGLESRLWGGFSQAALRDLAALAAGGPPREAAEAAWVIARWHAAAGDLPAALAAIARMRAIHPPAAGDRRQFALEALFLCRLGRGAEARALLAARRGPGFDASLALLEAGSWRPAAGAPPDDPAAEALALAAINAVFRHHGLQEIAKRDPALPLGLDNLPARDPGPKAGGGGRVTVIVPAFDAAATLATALRGLAGQTHADLEVLVVDDARRRHRRYRRRLRPRRPRFRLIRQPANQGGYAARNRALAAATGDLVTVHDADDWSHPEKIARQVRALRRSGAASTFSAWVRTTPDLSFLGPARVYPDLMGLNDSSALIRRELFDRFGGWDVARIAADKELIWRFERLAGRPREGFRRRTVLPGCPLAFGRLVPSSLTRSDATHVLSIYHGIRRDYREAAALWHAGLDRRAVARAGWRARPPYFPAPLAARAAPAEAAEPRHDLLLVGDFNFQGGTQKSALNMLAAARAAGLSAALLHYRRYDQDVTAPLDPEVRRTAWAEGVRIVAPGERVRAATVIVTYPPVFAEVMDRFPAVEHDRLVVVVNQMAERDLAGTDPAYDPARVRAHLAALLGGEGFWAPISARVRALMAADPRYPPAFSDTWTPLIDTAAWCARTPRWRGAERARPVVGRHGRDHPLKWPGDPSALRAAYCAGRPCAARRRYAARGAPQRRAARVESARPPRGGARRHALLRRDRPVLEGRAEGPRVPAAQARQGRRDARVHEHRAARQSRRRGQVRRGAARAAVGGRRDAAAAARAARGHPAADRALLARVDAQDDRARRRCSPRCRPPRSPRSPTRYWPGNLDHLAKRRREPRAACAATSPPST